MGFADDMKEHDEEWTESQGKANRFGQLPDGTYQAPITECRVEAYSERWTFFIKFENEQGNIAKFNGLDNEIGRSIAAQDAKMLGYLGPLSELDEWCATEAAIGLVCEINVRTKAGKAQADGSPGRDFTNVYINRVLGKGESFEPSSVGAGGAKDADDDIPF